ncbi:MAG: hypothetical protein R2860_16765 [Desulfobacterales bacterium]
MSGTRNQISRSVRVAGKTISEIGALSIEKAFDFFSHIQFKG